MRRFVAALFVVVLVPWAGARAESERRPRAVVGHGGETVVEGDQGITSRFVATSLSFPPNSDVTATYTTVDGTATAADGDYEPTSGTFVIPAGTTEGQSIELRIVGDRRVEADEFFTLIVDFTGATDPPPYEVFITNDDAPALTVSSPRQAEGNAGTALMTFAVTLTPAAGVPVIATYATNGGTATAGTDYQVTQGTITFAPGETQQAVSVLINGDTTIEPDETFLLTVMAGPGTQASGTGTIVNDDVPVITVANVTANEGNAGTTALTFTVTLTTPSSVPVVANFQTGGGTATAGVDYQGVQGQVTFVQGVTPQQTITVNVIGDTTAESDETFVLTVTPQGGAPVTATGTIVNDDARLPARLNIVSGNNQQGRLGQRLAQPLVVQLVDDTGAPIAGQAVQWRVTKGVATLDPATGITDAQGRASTNVTVLSVGAIEIEAASAGFTALFGVSSATSFASRATGPVAVPIAVALDSICARNEDTFNTVCRALAALSDADLTPTLEHVAPQQSGAQSKVSSEVISAVTTGIGARLSALRTGVERFSIQQLSFDWNGRNIPLGALMKTLLPMQDAGGDGDDDYNGWSAFLSGNLGDGQRNGRLGTLDFDLKSRGVMFGVDRQFGESIFGASLNLSQLESELDQNVGSLDTTGYALSIYGSRGGLFANNAPGSHYDGMHIDGSITVGRNTYDSEHVVDIAGMPLARATSENDANLLALAGVTGFEAHRGRADFDFSVSGTWSRAQVDDLAEDGDGPLILFVERHDIDSLVGSAALNVRAAYPVSFGTLIPSARAEMIHEFKSGARLVTARFLRDRLNTAFTIPIDRPDANYGKVSLGLQGVFPRGVSAYVEVTQDVLRSDLEFRMLQFNVSKSF